MYDKSKSDRRKCLKNNINNLKAQNGCYLASACFLKSNLRMHYRFTRRLKRVKSGVYYWSINNELGLSTQLAYLELLTGMGC